MINLYLNFKRVVATALSLIARQAANEVFQTLPPRTRTNNVRPNGPLLVVSAKANRYGLHGRNSS